MSLGTHDPIEQPVLSPLDLEEARLRVSEAERRALGRAEAICAKAEAMLQECVSVCEDHERQARAETQRMKDEARAEIARLLRDAIALVDQTTADARRDRATATSGLADVGL